MIRREYSPLSPPRSRRPSSHRPGDTDVIGNGIDE